MASSCIRFMSRSSLSSIKSAIRSNSVKSPIGKSSWAPGFSFPSGPSFSSPRRFSSRTSSELGCAQSLLPLHSAVAVARMTSRLSLNTSSTSCRVFGDVFNIDDN
ncbi:hypothetical protein M5689_007760 [Euphorbia peplus]|nr:hypothetical protein M5689_007760 [Euphorbia peplus]